jgi:hypothetical protein
MNPTRSGRHTLLAFAAVVLAFPGPAPASILSMNRYVLDLTKPDEAKAKAEWSGPERIAVTADGLGWGTPAEQGSRDVWLQTTEPFALGLSWRPTMSASLRVTVNGPGENGQVYARYSADGKHWTTWQPLEAGPPPPGTPGMPKGPTQTFRGWLRVPYRERAKYAELLQEYTRRQDVPWSSDEEALAREVVRGDPQFFAKQTPFVGYVQLLYECQLPAGRRLRGLEVEAGWGVGGLHTIPKDPATKKGRDGPWRFKAD